MPTDESLMMSAKMGNLTTVSTLYMRHKVGLYNYFLRRTNSTDQSEDLIQSVFEKVIKYKHTYSAEVPFAPWLYRIAHNAHSDIYRKESLSLPGEEEINKLRSESEDEETGLEDKKKRLKIALQKLSEEQRHLIIMTRYQQMPYAEVALTLGCTEGAVSVKVHRAMKALKQKVFNE